MEEITASNAISESLLVRDVYCVCFTERDSLDLFHGELSTARRKFFTGGQKAVKVGKNEIIKGFDGKLKGKLTRRSLYWQKKARGVALEEAFDQKGGSMVVRRDFRNAIVSKVYYDKSQRWLKSEYFNPGESGSAQVLFKPCGTFDGIERFDYDSEKRRYRSTILYPAPYQSGTAEQSLVNARFGEPQLIVSAQGGEFCYCPEAEANNRLAALNEINEGTIVLMPAWEIKDGALNTEDVDEDSSITFTSLEEYAKIEPKPDAVPEAPAVSQPGPFTSVEEKAEPDTISETPAQPEPVQEESLPAEPVALEAPELTPTDSTREYTEPDAQDILEAARRAVAQGLAEELPTEPAPQELPVAEAAVPASEEEAILAAAKSLREDGSPDEDSALEESHLSPLHAERAVPDIVPAFDGEELGDSALSTDSAAGFRGTVLEGKISGRGRTEQRSGLTVYDGEYVDGKREGFGSYYYKDGSLCYAGFWKEDKKDGLGVSFRSSDHALHISNWKDGAPGEFVSLFDSEGNLRYSGRIENGKKEGAGITYNGTDGSVLIGKWKDGEPTGQGALFDREGNLLYTGAWKDGVRCGSGTEFDENGEIVFSGEWKDGKYHNGILYKRSEA